MLGFADIEDDDMLTIADVSRRCGYARPSSFYRYLKAKGVPRPRACFRGRYRGGDVKAWYAALSRLLHAVETSPAPLQQTAPDEGGEVVDMAAAQQRMLSRMRGTGRP